MRGVAFCAGAFLHFGNVGIASESQIMAIFASDTQQVNLRSRAMGELRIVVLAKQVPDTRNVGKDAMKPDGTVNRGALPAIFNPEDLNALEQALRIKDQVAGARVTLLTMGPPRAAEIIREGLYRGADDGVLLTDRAFAGSDTLATSYALACTLRKLNPDMVICGRQAIDGDTAQVGPQVAQKLGWPQITYAEAIEYQNGVVTVRRRVERGVEVLRGKLPMVVTVNGSAPACRSRHAKLLMQWKRAYAPSEGKPEGCSYAGPELTEWNTSLLEVDPPQLGLSGSPTKVKTVENVVFQVKEAKRFEGNAKEVDTLVRELLTNHTIG